MENVLLCDFMTASTRFQKWCLSLRRYSVLHLCFAKNLTETLYVPVVIAVASQNSRQEGIRVESSIFRAKCCSEPMKLHCCHVTQWRGNWLKTV